jgi:predicted phage terminase large subunit-like protein
MIISGRSGHGSMDSIHNRQQIQQIVQNWKLTPATFAHKISGGSWIPAPHLMYISSRVAKGIARGNARIIISAPPRHGKSQLSSIYTPGWVLENYPHYKTILAGYGADLATGFSRQVRDMFQDKTNHDLLTSRIRTDASRVEAFLTEQGGGMYAVGLGGAITGRGAHVLLIDDYIKEIKEALSPAYRDYIWNWFVTTAFTRLEPGGSCIIIATRWHSDDLIGRILANLADQNWEYIEIPAIAEEGDLLGRPVGAPLFPERYPLERLQELRTTLGSVFFQALFQQKPVDESKKMTDGNWLKIVDFIPIQERMQYKWARVWDLAATEGGGDYTVGSLIGYNQLTGDTVISNVIRRQISPGQVEALVRNTALVDGPEVKIRIEQEPGSAGISLVHHYKTNILPEFNVDGIPVVKNKLVRAQPLLAAAEAGKVKLLAGSWNEVFIREFDTFPGGENDDQVDTAGAGYTFLSGKKVYSASWGRAKQGKTANSNAIKRAQFTTATSGMRTGRATFGRR